MRKRMAAVLLAGCMIFSTGCGKTDTNRPQTQESDGAEDTSDGTEKSDGTEDTSDGTVGGRLQQDFESRMEEDPSTSIKDLAEGILSNEVIAFKGNVAEVQEGMLTGFSDEITGFDEGVMFSPMIGSIPFVGYIFHVPKDGDVDGFTALLEEKADPRWNICTEADETHIKAVENTIFFLMNPSSLEE